MTSIAMGGLAFFVVLALPAALPLVAAMLSQIIASFTNRSAAIAWWLCVGYYVVLGGNLGLIYWVASTSGREPVALQHSCCILDFGSPLLVTVQLVSVFMRRPLGASPAVCAHCGYSLVNLSSGRCPECGAASATKMGGARR
jgi:hypothetical protein